MVEEEEEKEMIMKMTRVCVWKIGQLLVLPLTRVVVIYDHMQRRL